MACLRLPLPSACKVASISSATLLSSADKPCKLARTLESSLRPSQWRQTVRTGEDRQGEHKELGGQAEAREGCQQIQQRKILRIFMHAMMPGSLR